jgi:hypothetical protein
MKRAIAGNRKIRLKTGPRAPREEENLFNALQNARRECKAGIAQYCRIQGRFGALSTRGAITITITRTSTRTKEKARKNRMNQKSGESGLLRWTGRKRDPFNA